MVTGAVGVRSELAFDLFYGAATLDAQSSVIPVLSVVNCLCLLRVLCGEAP